MDDLLDLVVLRDSARKLLAGGAERSTGVRGLWASMAEHGWLALGLPVAHGGLAQPFSALGVLYQELGRVLAPHTFLSASICLCALAELDDNDAAGDLISLALAGRAVPMAVMGGLGAGSGRVQGVIHNVPDADEATHLLVPIDDECATLVLVALPHTQVILEYRATWDETRRLFDIRFENLDLASVHRFTLDNASAAATRMAARQDLAVACDALGGAEAIFEETLAYLQVRRQFNRPIASFQALKHRCADLRTTLSAAQALVVAACRDFPDPQRDTRTLAACGRLYASSVYRRVTEDAIQLHGGIGFTWEHRCHRFLKRARLNDALGTTPERRKDAVAAALFRAARER